ncbi:hypothetical protein CASFOL_007688 [Castilleja foliolosa]|uniref:ATPase F1/V1/A1 complex alpha/beta subunit N-terminal domain-containing protein n=1 Tax=Castilleja foliolosa TaxID=1961234 RepID=A0ABD3E5A3_9LAMI
MRINPTTSGSGVSTLEKKNLGRIIQIIGPVLDVAFPPGKMPNIYNALVVKGRDTVGQPINVTCEVQQLLGNNRVRAVAMSATEGLMRGMEVIDTGAPLSVPVGGATLGRRAMTRNARRGGKIWVRIFPDKPVTVRPAETRMGSGKGSPEYWVAVVKPGRILYEMGGVTENIARRAILIAAS